MISSINDLDLDSIVDDHIDNMFREAQNLSGVHCGDFDGVEDLEAVKLTLTKLIKDQLTLGQKIMDIERENLIEQIKLELSGEIKDLLEAEIRAEMEAEFKVYKNNIEHSVTLAKLNAKRDAQLEMEAKQIFSLPDCKMQDGQTITITVSTK